MTDHDPKLTGRLHEDKPRRPRPDLSQHRTRLLALARRPQIVVPVALVLGALTGAAVVAAVTPASTATSEYQALEGRLDRAVEAKEEDIAEQRDQIRDLRVEKGKLESAANDVEKQQEAADARDAELASRESAVGAAEAAKKANEFGPGVHLVGTDIQPGQYRNAGTADCYWARLSSTSGDFGSILANDNVDGQAIVTIAASDAAFTSSRCGTWTKIG